MPEGRIEKSVPLIGGLDVLEARAQIIKILSENALLHESKKITHTVAVHERCGRDVEIILSKQWYIDILSNKELFLKAADKINWYPAYMKNRYVAWVENLKWDWCISRQRYLVFPFRYGIAKPVQYHNCDENMLPVNPLETNPGKPCSCGSNDFIPESSVFDTWATSSVTPK